MDTLLKELGNKRSPKRRSAAKKLRKLGDVSAGPSLLTALKEEVKDSRTWETQYQMIMAIGECGFVEALPYLKELSGLEFEATMVYTALGDAIVRLSQGTTEAVSAVFELIDTNNEMLIDGALRAVAMMRLIPEEQDVNRLVAFAEKYPTDHHLRFWVVAAAPGWRGVQVERFVSQCAQSDRQDIAFAAELARQAKYRKWQPL